jgi:hypothetical protein
MLQIQRPYAIQGRVILNRGKNHLAGSGVVLLNKGGAGGASSYTSVEDYVETTGRKVKGFGMGGEIETKLRNLKVQSAEPKKKRENIKFNL